MIEPYFDAHGLVEDSIRRQQEVIRAKYILALARIDRHVAYLESHKSQVL